MSYPQFAGYTMGSIVQEINALETTLGQAITTLTEDIGLKVDDIYLINNGNLIPSETQVIKKVVMSNGQPSAAKHFFTAKVGGTVKLKNIDSHIYSNSVNTTIQGPGVTYSIDLYKNGILYKQNYGIMSISRFAPATKYAYSIGDLEVSVAKDDVFTLVSSGYGAITGLTSKIDIDVMGAVGYTGISDLII